MEINLKSGDENSDSLCFIYSYIGERLWIGDFLIGSAYPRRSINQLFMHSIVLAAVVITWLHCCRYEGFCRPEKLLPCAIYSEVFIYTTHEPASTFVTNSTISAISLSGWSSWIKWPASSTSTTSDLPPIKSLSFVAWSQGTQWSCLPVVGFES